MEPTIGERLCRLWVKIDSEDDYPHTTIPTSSRHSAQTHTHPYRHIAPYSNPYPAFHHGYHPAMAPMMPDARGGRLLLPSPVVFSPPRLGHPPYFKARPWWGPPHPPNFMPPHGPPVAMNHGPPHNSMHGPQQHRHQNSNYPQPQTTENSSPGMSGSSLSGGPQNFSSSTPPSHSYSAFRNNLRTNPPPMSYSAKRMQAHTQQQNTDKDLSENVPVPSNSDEKSEVKEGPPEVEEPSGGSTST